MKGVIGRFVAVLGCAGALAGSNGCFWYHDLVDPCYPERYEHVARQNTHEALMVYARKRLFDPLPGWCRPRWVR